MFCDICDLESFEEIIHVNFDIRWFVSWSSRAGIYPDSNPARRRVHGTLKDPKRSTAAAKYAVRLLVLWRPVGSNVFCWWGVCWYLRVRIKWKIKTMTVRCADLSLTISFHSNTCRRSTRDSPGTTEMGGASPTHLVHGIKLSRAQSLTLVVLTSPTEVWDKQGEETTADWSGDRLW